MARVRVPTTKIEPVANQWHGCAKATGLIVENSASIEGTITLSDTATRVSERLRKARLRETEAWLRSVNERERMAELDNMSFAFLDAEDNAEDEASSAD